MFAPMQVVVRASTIPTATAPVRDGTQVQGQTWPD